jgi:hypothetical protein
LLLREAQKSVEDRAIETVPLAEHRRPTREERVKGSVSTSTGKRDADYLTARIARDNPDILQRMKAGEFKSVRQAAKVAGIVRERMSVPVNARGLN